MIQMILVLIVMFWKKIPLTQFQFLLCICLLEVKTGILFGDYYYGTILLSYLLLRFIWYKILHAPVAQWNRA
jgi:hypothetical protein